MESANFSVVIPAKAGMSFFEGLDPRFRGDDGSGAFT
jgi:hypothetical protein